ncbi:hypothetical protein QZM18_27940 [Burkholderia diffusa]|uniref:hypothetical protein n=1 Tax=Burkholderia diffusa TaxID=488732 RepID=UPI002656E446|nr:hypothetical protein [Burkholderia diffusa]MDN7907920.1 hypothetical protein [Burkholderia diffusa]
MAALPISWKDSACTHAAFVQAVRDLLDALDLHAIERPAESSKPVGIADASFNAEPDRDMAGPAYSSPARRRRCEPP